MFKSQTSEHLLKLALKNKQIFQFLFTSGCVKVDVFVCANKNKIISFFWLDKFKTVKALKSW